MLANPLPEERRGSSLVQQRGFAFLLRLFILVLAQQSVPLVRQVVDPSAMLKTSSAFAGFLLAPQVALAQAAEPSLDTITYPGSGQVTVTWADPSDSTILSYKMRYRKRVSFTSSDIAWTEVAIAGSDATTTTYTFTGLDNGYDYDFEWGLVRSGGTSWGPQYSFSPRTTSATAPAKPTGFTATAGDGSVTLKWTASTDRSIGAYQYQQQKGSDPISSWMTITGSASRSTSHTVTGLTNNASYKFKIRSSNSVNYSPATDWVTVTPAVPTSAGFTVSPTNLTIGEGSIGTYTVKLNAAPSSNVVVTVGGTSGDVTVSGSPLTFTPSNYSTAQDVIVRAGADSDTTDDTATLTHSYTGGGDTYNSISIASVVVTVIDTGTTSTPVVSTPTLKPPTGLSVDPGPDRLYLSWTAPVDANRTGWQVRHGPLGFLVGGSIGTVWGEWSAISGASTTSYTITGATISEGTTHNVELRATDGSRFSTKVTGSALPDSGVSHDLRVGGGGFSLPVDEGSSVTYRIRLKSRGTGPVTVTPSCTACDLTFNPTSVTFSTTNWNDWQNITVSAARDTDADDDNVTIGYAASGGGYPTVTDTSRVVIKDTGTTTGGDIAPAQPTNLVATAGNRQVTLTWTKPPGTITGYEVRYAKGSDPYTEWAAIPGATGTTESHTVSGLVGGSEYAFEVRAVNGALKSVDSGVARATPTGSSSGPKAGSSSGGGGSTPSTPSSPSRTTRPTTPVFQLPTDPADVTEGEAITLELTSSSPLTGTHAVSLTFSDRDGSGFTAADIPGDLGPRSFNAAFGSSPSKTGRITIPTNSDSAVEGREHYRIKLNAGSGYSLGSTTTADGTLLDPVPAKPTGLTATPGHGEVTLNWDDPNDASITGWQVQYKEGDGSYGNWMDIPNSTATTTRHTVTGLTNGSRYAFRLRAVNAVGAGEASDPVAATPLHPDTARAAKARKAALTGLSRATLSSATDVIGGRLSGELSITPDSDGGSIGEQALGIVEDILGISDTALPTSLSMEGIGEQLWHQTFQLSPPPPTAIETADGQHAQAAATTAAQQRNWALWGAGDLRLFNGDDAQESMSYEGNLKTAWVGIDQQFSPPWRAGVAASFSMGESDYTYQRTSGETAGGTIKSRLTAFYPYGAVQLNERLRLWGTAGVGFGGLRHQESSNATDSQQQEQQGDLRMQLALVGFEQQLSSIGTWDFSLAGDLGLIKTTSQWPDHSGLEDLSMTLTRARLGVDSSFPLSETTRGYVNLRGRMDGGELQMGAAEAVAGLHYSSARLSALLQGRQTYAFNGDYSESGIMGQLLFSSQEDGTGLALELQPSYGHYGDAQQPFFFDDDQLQALTGQSTSQQDEGLGLKSILGYGFRPHDNHLLLTPFAELTFTQGRRYLLGVGLNMEAPPWEVKLTGSREETGNSSPTGKLQLLFSTEL